MPEVSLDDFARSFGTTPDDISSQTRALIAEYDFGYRLLDREERDRIVLEVLRKIESDTQIIGDPERKDVWQKGWDENLRDFAESNHDLDALTPKFIRPNQPMRLNQDYIVPSNPTFELNYLRVFRHWLFSKYLRAVDAVYEFGCGTGFNLIELAKMYPRMKLHGLDFVPAARDLVSKIGEIYGWNMTGHLFDMTAPDEGLQIEGGSAAVTFGAIEQLAGRFEAFLAFLLRQRPGLCISLEPTVELYDENNLVDYLAIKFHRKRGYTENYLPSLRELEAQGKIEILKVKRLFMGSLFMEGYTYMVWKPTEES